MDELEESEVIGIRSFYWFVKPEDIYSEEVELPSTKEEGTTFVSVRDFIDFDLNNGRLKHKWVPTWKNEAIRYLMTHEDAAGLRAASDVYYLVSIKTEEDIVDKSETYPKMIPEGCHGMVLKVPIKEKIMKGDPSPDLPISFGCNYKNDRIDLSEPRAFSAISMEIMSPEEIEKMAVIEVITGEALREDSSAVIPVIGGTMDPRMGSLAKDEQCPTCHLPFDPKANSTLTCSGHFGYIRLPEPIPHILFLGEKSRKGDPSRPLLDALNKTCYNCKRVMLPDDLLESLRPKILHEFETGGKNMASRRRVRDIMSTYFTAMNDNGRICPHCATVSPNVNFYFLSVEFSYDTKREDGATSLNYRAVRDIFADIPNSDCYFLALNPETSRPENMLLEVLPVIPNASRPLKEMTDGRIMEDDLTKLYSAVITDANKLLIAKQRANRHQIRARKLLLFSVSRVIDNHNQTIGSGGSKKVFTYNGGIQTESLEGILNRLTGKEGSLRHNLQSKYVNNVGYSAISPDPNLAIDEVGVPIDMVLGDIGITYPEIVTNENIVRVRGYIQNVFDDVHPRAKRIFEYKNANVSDRLFHGQTAEHLGKQQEKLRPGMTVTREIMDGDICLFNRAPSLHRQSVMALRTRMVSTKSLSMNPTICIPFNADYDGDAMKAHFVQSEAAKQEAIKLMSLTKNIIHSRYGMLTVATDQDQTSGLYLLTYTDKEKANTWNSSTGLGFNAEGIAYVSKKTAVECYSTVFSEIRDGKELRTYRTMDSLPESDAASPDGPGYTGRALFNHLFTVLDAEYVSATFPGDTPLTDVLEDGSVEVRRENGEAIKEQVLIRNGKLIKGTLEKSAFGEGGASIAPSFIYHEGYEAGQKKLVEFIEMATRLGFAAHRVIGYTMGVADVSAIPVQGEIDRLYNRCAEKILKIDQAFANGQLKQYVLAHTPEKRLEAQADPLAYIEDRVLKFTDQFEKTMLNKIEDYQGSGNAMQIAVRSKARGSPESIRQMAGAFGQVRLEKLRVTTGIGARRVLSHYPKGSLDPKHRGFVRGNYSKGMEPDEYFITSIAGRRSTAESAQGNIAESGYLERKMVRALESCVVNQRRQVVNLRTKRVISPIVGDDGLSPYHIRGNTSSTNKRGYTLTLQPFFYDHACKHGLTLEDDCLYCVKGSDLTAFIKNLDTMVSETTRKIIENKLAVREMTKPNVKKLAKRLNEYYEDSLCRIGEAIGCTAGQNIGEPATQAALRSFHFAGKVSVQGSVARLRQILEYSTGVNKSPMTKLYLKEGATEADAKRIHALLIEVKGKEIIKLITYDVEKKLLLVQFDFSAMRTYRIPPDIALNQIKTALNIGSTRDLFSFNIIQGRVDPENPFIIQITPIGYEIKEGLPNYVSDAALLYAKELIIGSNFNGIAGVTNIELSENTEKQRWMLTIKSASGDLLETIIHTFAGILDLSMLETNNHRWIERNFGLEAAIANVYDELDFQMNLTTKGIGDYDNRYIRTIVDCMGEYGYMKSLAPSGLSGKDNPSVLGGMSVEGVKEIIMGGAIMGNKDPLLGVTESIVVGSIPKIGDFTPA
jgi:DNA-directed RNA polymerase subunit A'